MERNRYYFNISFRIDIKNYKELWFDTWKQLYNYSFYTDDRSLISDENMKILLFKIITYEKLAHFLEIKDFINVKNWMNWKFELIEKDAYKNKYEAWYWFIDCSWTDELILLENVLKN